MAVLQTRLNDLGQTWRDQEHAKFAENFEQTIKILARFTESADQYIPFLIRKAEKLEEYLHQR